MGRAIWLLLLVGCATAPAPAPTPAPTIASAAPVAAAMAPPTCRKRDPNEARLLENITDSLRQPDAGAYKLMHAPFYRYLPTLHETGVVTSIVATHSKDGDQPIFALTMMKRKPDGSMDAHLGFAAMPCPDGDLALVAPLVPLGTPDATIDRVRPIPYLGATELEIDTGEAESTVIGVRPKLTRRDVVVGVAPGAKIAVIGTIPDLDPELPPENGIRRKDEHVFGSGWYRHEGGASYLLVHRPRHDADDLCKSHAKRPDSPPQLKLIARIDPQHGFTTDPTLIGNGYVALFPDNQPKPGMSDDKDYTMRIGPTAMSDDYWEGGPPANDLWGIFDSQAAAEQRAKDAKYKKPLQIVPTTDGRIAVTTRVKPPPMIDCAR